jgi:hypothetical protein
MRPVALFSQGKMARFRERAIGRADHTTVRRTSTLPRMALEYGHT